MSFWARTEICNIHFKVVDKNNTDIRREGRWQMLEHSIDIQKVCLQKAVAIEICFVVANLDIFHLPIFGESYSPWFRNSKIIVRASLTFSFWRNIFKVGKFLTLIWRTTACPSCQFEWMFWMLMKSEFLTNFNIYGCISNDWQLEL